jgi:hypothetical protein
MKSKNSSKVLTLLILLTVAPNPLTSLELIDDCCLYNHIFTLSKRDPATDPTLKKKSFSIKGVQDPPRLPAESVAAGRLVTYLLQHRIAEFIQLNGNSTLPWLLAGLAPWRGAKHDDPPKREPKFLSSLITKHELMYGEDVRNVVEDIFETGKMSKLCVVASTNAGQQLKRHEAGKFYLKIRLTSSGVGTGTGRELADDYIYCVALRVGSEYHDMYISRLQF